MRLVCVLVAAFGLAPAAGEASVESVDVSTAGPMTDAVELSSLIGIESNDLTNKTLESHRYTENLANGARADVSFKADTNERLEEGTQGNQDAQQARTAESRPRDQNHNPDSHHKRRGVKHNTRGAKNHSHPSDPKDDTYRDPLPSVTRKHKHRAKTGELIPESVTTKTAYFDRNVTKVNENSANIIQGLYRETGGFCTYIELIFGKGLTLSIMASVSGGVSLVVDERGNFVDFQVRIAGGIKAAAFGLLSATLTVEGSLSGEAIVPDSALYPSKSPSKNQQSRFEDSSLYYAFIWIFKEWMFKYVLPRSWKRNKLPNDANSIPRSVQAKILVKEHRDKYEVEAVRTYMDWLEKPLTDGDVGLIDGIREELVVYQALTEEMQLRTVSNKTITGVDRIGWQLVHGNSAEIQMVATVCAKRFIHVFTTAALANGGLLDGIFGASFVEPTETIVKKYFVEDGYKSFWAWLWTGDKKYKLVTEKEVVIKKNEFTPVYLRTMYTLFRIAYGIPKSFTFKFTNKQTCKVLSNEVARLLCTFMYFGMMLPDPRLTGGAEEFEEMFYKVFEEFLPRKTITVGQETHVEIDYNKLYNFLINLFEGAQTIGELDEERVLNTELRIHKVSKALAFMAHKTDLEETEYSLGSSRVEKDLALAKIIQSIPFRYRSADGAKGSYEPWKHWNIQEDNEAEEAEFLLDPSWYYVQETNQAFELGEAFVMDNNHKAGHSLESLGLKRGDSFIVTMPVVYTIEKWDEVSGSVRADNVTLKEIPKFNHLHRPFSSCTKLGNISSGTFGSFNSSPDHLCISRKKLRRAQYAPVREAENETNILLAMTASSLPSIDPIGKLVAIRDDGVWFAKKVTGYAKDRSYYLDPAHKDEPICYTVDAGHMMDPRTNYTLTQEQADWMHEGGVNVEKNPTQMPHNPGMPVWVCGDMEEGYVNAHAGNQKIEVFGDLNFATQEDEMHPLLPDQPIVIYQQVRIRASTGWGTREGYVRWLVQDDDWNVGVYYNTSQDSYTVDPVTNEIKATRNDSFNGWRSEKKMAFEPYFYKIKKFTGIDRPQQVSMAFPSHFSGGTMRIVKAISPREIEAKWKYQIDQRIQIYKDALRQEEEQRRISKKRAKCGGMLHSVKLGGKIQFAFGMDDIDLCEKHSNLILSSGFFLEWSRDPNDTYCRGNLVSQPEKVFTSGSVDIWGIHLAGSATFWMNETHHVMENKMEVGIRFPSSFVKLAVSKIIGIGDVGLKRFVAKAVTALWSKWNMGKATTKAKRKAGIRGALLHFGSELKKLVSVTKANGTNTYVWQDQDFHDLLLFFGGAAAVTYAESQMESSASKMLQSALGSVTGAQVELVAEHYAGFIIHTNRISAKLRKRRNAVWKDEDPRHFLNIQTNTRVGAAFGVPLDFLCPGVSIKVGGFYMAGTENHYELPHRDTTHHHWRKMRFYDGYMLDANKLDLSVYEHGDHNPEPPALVSGGKRGSRSGFRKRTGSGGLNGSRSVV